MCVSPTLCGLYFVLVPWEQKKGYFKGLEEDTKSITYEDGRDDNLPTQGHTWTDWLMFCEFDDTARHRKINRINLKTAFNLSSKTQAKL